MSDSMLPVVNFYYRNAEDSNCIPELDKFFNGLGENEYVVANFSNIEGECGVNMEKMTNISNHLSSSKCWSSIQDWHVDVEYTIDHPSGDILVSDNKIKNLPSANRKESLCFWRGTFSGSKTVIELERFKLNKAECVYSNMTKSSFVKITKSKIFTYSTKNSSWKYKLCISWEGINKEEAELSEKKYYVTIETDDITKASKNVRYTIISFLEKILDIEFIRSNRKVIHFF